MIGSRERFVAALSLAGLLSACGGEPAPAGPPTAAELIRLNEMPRAHLEALCPTGAMSDGASFAYFERTAAELELGPDDGAPVADPRYGEVRDSRWVSSRRLTGRDGQPVRATLWIGQLKPGVHDSRFLTIPDKDGRNIRGGWDGDQRRFTSAVSCVLHIEGATREDATAMLREYREGYYDGMGIGTFPGTVTAAAPLGQFAEWRWVNGNNPDQYVETDLLAPKPGETGVTLVRRYVFW
ncbi:hypothetical protein GCM10009116_20720 [Brevundimonas basaltis]